MTITRTSIPTAFQEYCQDALNGVDRDDQQGMDVDIVVKVNGVDVGHYKTCKIIKKHINSIKKTILEHKHEIELETEQLMCESET